MARASEHIWLFLPVRYVSAHRHKAGVEVSRQRIPLVHRPAEQVDISDARGCRWRPCTGLRSGVGHRLENRSVRVHQLRNQYLGDAIPHDLGNLRNPLLEAYASAIRIRDSSPICGCHQRVQRVPSPGQADTGSGYGIAYRMLALPRRLEVNTLKYRDVREHLG